MTIIQEIRCPVCLKPFVNNELVELDAVNTVYHIKCDGIFVEPSSGLGLTKRDAKSMVFWLWKTRFNYNI